MYDHTRNACGTVTTWESTAGGPGKHVIHISWFPSSSTCELNLTIIMTRFHRASRCLLWSRWHCHIAMQTITTCNHFV